MRNPIFTSILKNDEIRHHTYQLNNLTSSIWLPLLTSMAGTSAQSTVVSLPVVPVGDRFLCVAVGIDQLQLRQWDAELPVLPLDEHEHLTLSVIPTTRTSSSSLNGEIGRSSIHRA